MSEYLDVCLTVFIDTDHHVQIVESLNGITGVTGYNHSKGTNIVNVVAKWKESELENKRKEVEVIPHVKYVKINRRGKSRGLIESVNISDAVIAIRKRKYPITKKEVIILSIPIALVVASIPVMKSLDQEYGIIETESQFWGILGIESTIALGVLLFLMQTEKDRRTNEIIQKQNDRYTQSKLFLCNKIIQHLREFKNTYTTILSYIQDFDTKKNDSQFLEELKGLVLLSDNKIKNLIPVITEYITLAIDKLEDVELGINIRYYLDGLYGPIHLMEEARKKGDPYCSLKTTIPPVKDLIKAKKQEIEELIVRMERERPTRLDTAVNKKT
jgi:hypothetical protein